MERAIRIGKDFNVLWSIRKRVDGERQPYELAGKELVLRYRTASGLYKEATEWKTEGNTIIWTFRGREQKALGSYELILTENGGKDGMVTVDTCRAFKLVEHSCEETEGSGSDIVIEDVVLESEVAFAPIVIEGGGGSYDDTEIKKDIADLQEKDAEQSAKLAELSEANEVLKEAQQFTDVAIKDLQDMKIDRENDDYYPKMAVGTADNLAGVDEVDSEFNFRQSGGGAITDGVARVQSIKGNSVVWNQVFNAANIPASQQAYARSNEDGTIEMISLPSGVWVTLAISNPRIIAGHNYLIAFNVISGTYSTTNTYGDILGKTVYPNSPIITPYTGGTANVTLRAAECLGMVFCIDIHDLTQMFGAGNEPTTIEEFYQRRPMGVDMNAYNEGEVIHMDVQSIESVGVNQWDEEWELGRIDVSTGNDQALYDSWRSKNFTEVIPNAEYYIKGGALVRIVYYDKDFKFVDWWGCDPYKLTTMPSNVRYVRLTQQNSTAYVGGISINLSDTAINGQYFPYIKRQEDLSLIRKYFPDGMKSAGSAHDEIRYNKVTQKWEKVVRIGEVDLGAFNYIYQPPIEGTFPHGYYQTIVEGKAIGNSNMLCSMYSVNVNWTSEGIRGSESSNYVYVKDSAYTDAASFKAAMQGVILYYELAEPIVTELDAEDQFKDLDYQVWNAGTEKAIAEGKSSALAADITYGFNAIGKIKELESLVAALRAKVGI